MIRILLFLLSSVMLFAGSMTVDEAFKPSVLIQNDKVHIIINMADHIHLTKNALKFSVEPKELVSLGKYTLPKSQKDEFGDDVYVKKFDLYIPLVAKKKLSGNIKFKLIYQGCSDKGFCYPPVSKLYLLKLNAGGALPFHDKATKKPTPDRHVGLSKEESIAATFKNKSFGIVLLTFFGFGLLLAMTPCIFPMIPILSSIIVSQGKSMTARRGFWLSLIYVLSMALTYTIAGILAGLFGANIQAAMQNQWVISIFALLFVALAFSMFGFYELQLPASWQSKLSKTSDEAGHKGGMIGVAIMGFLSALIVGPCVAPPLAGALIYIGHTGNALLGGAALFVMALGMGMPLLLIGTGAGKFMPKPGGWMTAVSKVFGVVMLGVAIWMLSRILPDMITMLLWAILIIVSAVYMGSFEPLGDKRSWNALIKGVGIAMFIYALFIFFGAFTGAKNPIDPLKILKEKTINSSMPDSHITFERVGTLSRLQKLIKNSKKPLMVDFRANWCVSCKELEDNTFNDPNVVLALKNFAKYQVDVTSNSDEEKSIMKHFAIFGPPAILFFKNGKELRSKRIVGYLSPDKFVNKVRKIL